MVKPKGHSQSQIYNNHDKTSTDIPSGFEFVAEQIKNAQEEVKRLERHSEIMSGKGPGDLTGMSKAQQTMWFNFGNKLTSDRYKKSRAGFTGRMSNEQYDNYVRKGIAQEIAGKWARELTRGPNSGAYVNYMAQKKKKKRIT